MITTRGCPGKCVFCSKSVYNNTLRSQSPGRIVDEIEYWKTKLPIKEIPFFDDDFTMARKRTVLICDEMIKRNINLPWTCTTRVDFLSKELLVKIFFKPSSSLAEFAELEHLTNLSAKSNDTKT